MFITSYKATLQKNRLMALEPVRDYLCGDGDDRVTSTATAAHVLVDCIRMHEEAEEHMVVLCMNASGRITGVFEAGSGGINDTDALSAYIREHVQVITAHTEECHDAAGVCISIVAPPFIQFFDADHNRVDILIDIEKPG